MTRDTTFNENMAKALPLEFNFAFWTSNMGRCITQERARLV